MTGYHSIPDATKLQRAAKEINWNETWQRQWRPLLVGERWYLAPPWSRKKTPEGRIRLSLHAGNFFGNGDHATTQMILEAMERLPMAGKRFADIGCGTGLLCIAAKQLGAVEVSGCDLDPGAIRSAHRRFRAARYLQGSTENYCDEAVDIAVANLALGVLEQIEAELHRILRPGGTLLVSGILTEQGDAAQTLFATNRWTHHHQATSEDWLLFTFQKA